MSGCQQSIGYGLNTWSTSLFYDGETTLYNIMIDKTTLCFSQISELYSTKSAITLMHTNSYENSFIDLRIPGEKMWCDRRI